MPLSNRENKLLSDESHEVVNNPFKKSKRPLKELESSDDLAEGGTETHNHHHHDHHHHSPPKVKQSNNEETENDEDDSRLY